MCFLILKIQNIMDNNDLKTVTVHDFSSDGRVSRTKSPKDGKMNQSFSHVENKLLSQLYLDRRVNSVIMQCKLDLDTTLAICKKLNIRHPFVQKKKIYHQMSTDFVLELKNGTYIAISFKKPDKLKKRVIQKEEIQRIYWNNLGYDFYIFTDNQFNEIKIYNYNFLSDLFTIEDYDNALQALHYVPKDLKKQSTDLRQLISKITRHIGLTFTESSKAIRILILNQNLKYNHDYKISFDTTLNQFEYYDRTECPFPTYRGK